MPASYCRLDIHILSHSLTLIAALLVLLMLLWHISTTHLIDDYGMPQAWADMFLKKQFQGGRGALWGVLFIAVPIDCLHALLALDWYHARRYPRPNTTTPTTTTQSSTTLPQTPHPLLLLLLLLPHPAPLILYNALLTCLLAAHTTLFFTSFPSNLAACHHPTAKTYFAAPAYASFSVLDRCWRINIDIHVSGGFAVAACTALMGCHVWCVGMGVWEWLRGERAGGARDVKEVGHEKKEADRGERAGSAVSQGMEERRMGMESGIRYRDWEQDRRKKRGSMSRIYSESWSSAESSKWSEALLECLVP